MATRRPRFARLAASSLPRACIGLTKEDHVIEKLACVQTSPISFVATKEIGDVCTQAIEKLEVQWNPVNTTTFGPWKFGRINGVGSNYRAKCF